MFGWEGAEWPADRHAFPTPDVGVLAMIKVTEVIKIHFVIPDAAGELFDAHTHGLEALGHKEFRCSYRDSGGVRRARS